MLVVEDLHFSYADQPVLRGLSLEARESELVGIVGPNGAGKTTLLKLVSGVLRPLQGRIHVGGRDLSTLSSAERARAVSVVPQGPQLPPSFRVADVVLMGRNPHLKLLQWEGRRDVEIATRAMELTKTVDLADRTVGSLSGGERQRAQVAMALAQEAPLMLLDEPTSDLDLAHQTAIMDLVRDVQAQKGGAVLAAMHDLTLAAQYCDRLVMLSEGSAYADGHPGEVLTKAAIKDVYDADVFIMPHPQGGTPVVLPVSQGVATTRDGTDLP